MAALGNNKNYCLFIRWHLYKLSFSDPRHKSSGHSLNNFFFLFLSPPAVRLSIFVCVFLFLTLSISIYPISQSLHPFHYHHPHQLYSPALHVSTIQKEYYSGDAGAGASASGEIVPCGQEPPHSVLYSLIYTIQSYIYLFWLSKDYIYISYAPYIIPCICIHKHTHAHVFKILCSKWIQMTLRGKNDCSVIDFYNFRSYT